MTARCVKPEVRPGARALPLLLAALAVAMPPRDAAAQAHFRVTDRVAVADPGPAAANIGTIGNGADLGMAESFEPYIHAYAFYAARGAPDRVIAGAHDITFYGLLARDFYKGAEVTVHRIVDGEMRVVRQDTVAAHIVSHWESVHRRKRMLSARLNRHIECFDRNIRPDHPVHYAVTAVDDEGRRSSRSSVLSLRVADGRALRADKRDHMQPKDALVAIPGADGGGSSRLTAPADVSVRGVSPACFEIAWQPVRGAAGYLVERTFTPPSQHETPALVLTGGREAEPIRQSDLVIVRKRFLEFDREAMVAPLRWNSQVNTRGLLPTTLLPWPDQLDDAAWRLVEHPSPGSGPGPGSVPRGGSTYLELTHARPARTELKKATYGGDAQDFYPVLRPGKVYLVEFWARADGNAQVGISMKGPHSSTLFDLRVPRHRLDARWRPYVTEVIPREIFKGNGAGAISIAAEGEGVIAIDNVRVYEKGTPFLGASDTLRARLSDSGVGMLRTHGFIKTKTTAYDLERFTNPGGMGRTPFGGNTLPQTLQIMAEAGVDPWLQVEPYLTPVEWRGLIEYLAAPYDPARDSPATKPWAAKRHAQGRAAPWTDSFDEVYFEIGNETWNRIFRPWTFQGMRDHGAGEWRSAGTVYGLFHDFVMREMRKSPYWEEAGLDDKLTSVLGGWGIHNFSYDAAAASKSADMLTETGYIDGWRKEDEGIPSAETSYATILSRVGTDYGRGIPVSRAAEKAGAERGRPYLVGIYEGGPSFKHRRSLRGKGDWRELERRMKSAAAGTATLDGFLAKALNGHRMQAHFLLRSGVHWASHAYEWRGGHALPGWALLSYHNRVGLGDFLEVETREVPIRPSGAVPKLEDRLRLPTIAVYATRGEDRLTVYVISRRLPGDGSVRPVAGDDGTTDVLLELPVRSASRLRRVTMTGDYTSQNFDTEEVRLLEEDMPVPADPGRIRLADVPPGEVVILVFDGVEAGG